LNLKGGVKMNNKILVAAILLAAILVGGYFVYDSGPVVSAQGSANLKVQPDEVSVNINVETRGSSAQIAQIANKGISEKLLLELEKIGFDKTELKFVNYNVYPDYDWDLGTQKLKGYVVSQQLVVETKTVDEVPGIVDAAISSGALVSYINFKLSDAKQEEYKKKALEEASKDAREKASAIAEGQGKKLGRLIKVENHDFYYPGPIPYYARGAEEFGEVAADKAKEAALNIAPQDLEITASINAQYKLRGFYF